jgi:hypothetical protein
MCLLRTARRSTTKSEKKEKSPKKPELQAMTSTRTVDFIGTTYSIRFGVAEGDVVTSNPVFLGTVKLDDSSSSRRRFRQCGR